MGHLHPRFCTWVPIVFIVYGPLEDVIRAHGIDAMMYADESQLYIIAGKTEQSFYCLKSA